MDYGAASGCDRGALWRALRSRSRGKADAKTGTTGAPEAGGVSKRAGCLFGLPGSAVLAEYSGYLTYSFVRTAWRPGDRTPTVRCRLACRVPRSRSMLQAESLLISSR